MKHSNKEKSEESQAAYLKAVEEYEKVTTPALDKIGTALSKFKRNFFAGPFEKIFDEAAKSIIILFGKQNQ